MTAIVADQAVRFTISGDMNKGYAVARDLRGNFVASGTHRRDRYIIVRSTGPAFHEMYPADGDTARVWLETAAREATK